MNETELIRKFLRNECTAEEAEFVLQYIADHPSVLNGLLDEDEWAALSNSYHIHPEIDDAMRRHVMSKTARRVFMRPLMAAAACIALVASVAYFFVFNPKEEIVSGAVAAISFEEIINNTDKEKEYMLPDGSSISLYPNSCVRFEKGMVSNRRISLDGKARFSVRKDSTRPFTVYASSTTTTALGTIFSVDDELAGKINVRLFEGKVVIKSMVQGSKMKDVYLKPGDQCLVDLNKDWASVSEIREEKEVKDAVASTNIAGKKQENKVPEPNTGAALSFSKTPVDIVFSKLESIYGVEINYEKSDISGAYFTGSFQKTDALATVIQVVCAMNGLEYTIKGKQITITKGTEKKISLVQPALQENKVFLSANDGLAVNPEEPTNKILNGLEITAPVGKDFYFSDDGWIVFKKSRLTDVLDLLQRLKKMTIIYSAADIKNVYLTGSIDNNKPVEETLNAICRMNGLGLSKGIGHFVITKN